MSDNNTDKPKKILNFSLVSSPTKTNIQKPSTPKPAVKTATPNTSGTTNHQVSETKIGESSPNTTKNSKQ